MIAIANGAGSFFENQPPHPRLQESSPDSKIPPASKTLDDAESGATAKLSKVTAHAHNDGVDVLDTSFYDDSMAEIHDEYKRAYGEELEEMIEAMGDLTPIKWSKFNKHLANIVEAARKEKGVEVCELAHLMDIPDQHLADYLNPEKKAVIGTFFLDAVDILNIDLRIIFPRALSEAEADKAMTCLAMELQRVQPYTVTRHMELSPGKTFSEHFARIIEQKIMSVNELTSIDTMDLDEYWGLKNRSFSIHDLVEATLSGSFEALFSTSPDPYEDLIYICDECLEMRLIDIIEIKPIGEAQRFELSKRIERSYIVEDYIEQKRTQMYDQLRNESDEADQGEELDTFSQYEDWNPQTDKDWRTSWDPNEEEDLDDEEYDWLDDDEEEDYFEELEDEEEEELDEIEEYVLDSLAHCFEDLISGELPDGH